MKRFIVRNQDIQLYDGINYFSTTISLFSQIEPKFELNFQVKQVEYFPGILHQEIYTNNKVKNLSLNNDDYDYYLTRISLYINLKEQKEKDDSLSHSLEKVKTQVNQEIYNYASSLKKNILENSLQEISNTVLSQAKDYIENKDINKVDNLLNQYKLKSKINDTESSRFKSGFLKYAQSLLDLDQKVTLSIDKIRSNEFRLSQTINNFKKLSSETEEEAIKRLINLNWKKQWLE